LTLLEFYPIYYPVVLVNVFYSVKKAVGVFFEPFDSVRRDFTRDGESYPELSERDRKTGNKEIPAESLPGLIGKRTNRTPLTSYLSG